MIGRLWRFVKSLFVNDNDDDEKDIPEWRVW